MRSTVLIPYCPLPADHGGKVEMMKHLEILRSLGECTIASAATRPVGAGWTTALRSQCEKNGFHVRLREDTFPGRSWKQYAGIAYAALCKMLRMERAFGHANPYHRFAFPQDWWEEITSNTDLAVINYSYWAWLPTFCPKVVILHDLLSHNMFGGRERESKDLSAADLVIVISKNEEMELRRRGVKNILWSPPVVKPMQLTLSNKVGIVGSANLHNREGLQWLGTSSPHDSLSIAVYGALAQYVVWPAAHKVVSYHDPYTPYKDCGIILLPTALGTGVQIKVVEALACGRAIIARRGALRGLPEDDEAWIEVDSPAEMWRHAELLTQDGRRRADQGDKARSYYERYLNHEQILTNLRTSYSEIIKRSRVEKGFEK